MTDTIIEKNEEINSFSFQIIHEEPEKNNIFIIFLDPQFNIVWMERPLLDYLGGTLANVSGKSIFDLIPAKEIISLVMVPASSEKTYNISELQFCVSPFSKKILKDCNLRIKLYQNDRSMITGYFIIISQIERLDEFR